MINPLFMVVRPLRFAGESKTSLVPVASGSGSMVVYGEEEQERLFPGGIGQQEFEQGHLGNCQLLSVLYGLSRNPMGQKLMQAMIQRRDDDGWMVNFYRFPGKKVPVYDDEVIKKRWSLKKDIVPKQVGGSLGMRILELAYARLMKLTEVEKYEAVPHEKILDVYESKVYHNQPEEVMRDITGLSTIGGMNCATRKGRRLTMTFLRQFAENPRLYIATLSTKKGKAKHGYLDFAKTQLGYHVCSLKKMDWGAQEVTYVNPHNTRIAQTVGMETFFKLFSGMGVMALPQEK